MFLPQLTNVYDADKFMLFHDYYLNNIENEEAEFSLYNFWINIQL